MNTSVAKQISIILVNYKSEKNILLCLASLKDFLIGIDYEIIIVNNDQQKTLREVKEKFSEVQIIEQVKNTGFGSAVNVGVKIAEGEILLILNPDTEIISGNFQEIIAEFLINKEVGIIGSRIIDESGQIQPWIAGVKKNLWDLLKNNLGIRKSQKIWKSQQKIDVDWVAATAMFTKRDLFTNLGGFDENIFMYFEDVDLCERIHLSGKRVVYFPNFVVKHVGGASFKNVQIQKKHYYTSQEYYFGKHCQRWEAVTIKLIRKFFYAL